MGIAMTRRPEYSYSERREITKGPTKERPRKCNMRKLKQSSNSQFQWITRTLKKFRRIPGYYRQNVPRFSDRIRALNERIRSNGRKRRKLSRKSKMHTMTTKYWFYTTREANMASCRRLRLCDSVIGAEISRRN